MYRRRRKKRRRKRRRRRWRVYRRRKKRRGRRRRRRRRRRRMRKEGRIRAHKTRGYINGSEKKNIEAFNVIYLIFIPLVTMNKLN